MKKKILLVLFLMMVVFIPSYQVEKQKEEIILVSEVEKENVFEPAIFLNGGEFSGEITEDTLLHKGSYTISKDLIIKEGIIVEVEAGSEIKYTKSDIDFIINGTYKVGQGIYNKVTQPSSFGTMNKVDASGYKNYWKQVKKGWTPEQRFNYQEFGTMNSFADHMTLDDAANYNQYWEQVKQRITAEQRYNYTRYGSFDGMPIQNNPLTGYTRHGLNSAISHDGVGIRPSSILDTVKNPIEIKPGSNHTVRYEGQEGVVNLNYDGEIVTTWSKSSKYGRVK